MFGIYSCSGCQGARMAQLEHELGEDSSVGICWKEAQ
jgi:hypothetical protein